MKTIINHGIPRSCKHWKRMRTAFLPASQLILPSIIPILYASSRYRAINQSPQEATSSQMPVICQNVRLWRTVVSSSKEREMLPPEGRGQKNAMYVENQKQLGAVKVICAMKFRGSSNTEGFVKHFGHYSERTRKPLEASFLGCSKGCFIVSTYRELGWRPRL